MDFCDGMMVTVRQGDTLYSLSMKHQVPLAVLLRANPYVDVYNLQIGDSICIPKASGENQAMLSPEMEMRMSTESEPERRNIEESMPQWERYVTQQGDTLDMVVGNARREEDDWEDFLEEFVERNGRDNIYLLPGVAYYRRK